MIETVFFKENLMSNNWLARFWGVIIRPQSYLNLAYLFLAFPLGLVYFIFFVTGLALGFPLIIVWVGLIILAVVFAAAWGLTLFERQMAIWLLRVNIGETGDPVDPNDDIWQRFKKYIANPVTWKGLLFLLLKFPLGVFSFTLGTTLVATSLALIFAPIALIFFPNAEVHFFNLAVHPAVAAAFGFVIGVLLVPISLHIMNGVAYVYGQIARLLLGKLEPEQKVAVVAPVAPVTSATPEAPIVVEAPASVPSEPVVVATPEVPVAAEAEDPLANLFPPEPDESAPSEPPAQS
jgi:hypothetical protein